MTVSINPQNSPACTLWVGAPAIPDDPSDPSGMEPDVETPAFSPSRCGSEGSVSGVGSDGNCSEVVPEELEDEDSDKEVEFEDLMRDVLDAESAIKDIDQSTVEDLDTASSTVPTNEPLVTTHLGAWSGFKIVGDNIDKTVHASFQRSDDDTARSLHHFHMYAVKDRVDLSMLSDSPPPFPTKIDVECLLPSESDIDAITEEISVLLSR